jgi:hypothetical protein
MSHYSHELDTVLWHHILVVTKEVLKGSFTKDGARKKSLANQADDYKLNRKDCGWAFLFLEVSQPMPPSTHTFPTSLTRQPK